MNRRTRRSRAAMMVTVPVVLAVACRALRQPHAGPPRLTFSPGSTTGRHRHSGPVVATVTTGQLTLVTGRNCTRQTYRVGDTFVEEGGKLRSKACNNGDTTTQTIVVFHLPVGEPPFTPAKAPACAY